MLKILKIFYPAT